jgi:sugar lactone lactonase YvrE
VLHDQARADGVRRYNDITTDAVGRLYAGTLDWDLGVEQPLQRTGCLHCLDIDGSSRVVARDVMITNGLGFSPSGDVLYHVDSALDLVWAYRVDERGALHDRRAFFEWPPGTPKPDGLAVARDGSVWVALHEAGVSVVHPDGTELRRVPVPAGLVTSLCFGGPELTTLYVVTGGPRPAAGTGRLFCYEADVAGVPVAPCRVPLNP